MLIHLLQFCESSLSLWCPRICVVVDFGELEKGWPKIPHALDIGFGAVDLEASALRTSFL